MGQVGLPIRQLTRSGDVSESQREIQSVQKMGGLLQKLEILCPRLSSADCTTFDGELKVISGNLFRDTVKTMGRSGVEPVARSLLCAGPCLRQKRYANTIPLKRSPRFANADGDRSSVKTAWGVTDQYFGAPPVIVIFSAYIIKKQVEYSIRSIIHDPMPF